MDLLDNNLIPDPYYRDNLLQMYALEFEEWEYRTNFTVEPAILDRQAVEMIFEGLDTHAIIKIND